MSYLFGTRAAVLAGSASLCALLSACLSSDIASSDSESQGRAAEIWPELNIRVKPDPKLEARVESILSTMTLEQKVAQMIQPEIRDISVEDMRRYGFGSYLNGGGAFPNNDKHASVEDWVSLAEKFYQASVDDSLDGSSIPTMWGTDAVHGHNNVIGATLFPHNIGLGAANNPELIENIARVTAREVMVTGIDWVFAPTVAVARDDRWGRTYESYSENPELVKAYSTAIVEGLQGHADKDFLSEWRVLSTVKHFIGDGGTEGGDDQGNNLATEQTLFDVHAQGYVGGLSAGAQTVMASFNSWHGDKIHGNQYLLTQVLKERMGFDGLVVGDWNGHGQVKDCSNTSCPQAANAGLDIFMVPTDAWKPLYHNTIDQVQTGIIPPSRIDDAVRRILRVKLRAGLFDKPSPAQRPLSGKTTLIGSPEHRDVARQAVRESLVLLKNKDQLLPLSPALNVLVAGDGADNIGKQSGGWSITWQGTGNTNQDFPGGSSIYDGIKHKINQAGGQVSLIVDGSFSAKPDVAIVVFGEEPYAEGNGDLDNLEYQRGAKKDLELLKSLKAQGIPVVSVFLTGRPLWVNPELNASDAFVVAWLPGSEGAGVSDVLFTDAKGKVEHDFSGKLSFSWPNTPMQAVLHREQTDYQPLFPYGYGLSYTDKDSLGDALPEVVVAATGGAMDKVLFDRSAKAPWSLSLFDAKGKAAMTSSVLIRDAIRVKTRDRRVQEDSVEVSWLGQSWSGIALDAAFPDDLRAFDTPDSALVFDIKLTGYQGEAVSLGVNCLSPSCSSQIALREHLTDLPQGWHTLAVDVACFRQQGADLGKVFTPFSLLSQQALTLGVSDIKWQAKAPLNARRVSCSTGGE